MRRTITMSEIKLALILLITLLVATFIAAGISVSHGDTKYNPMTHKYELTAPDAELRYNPFDGGSWSYQSPAAQLEYNAFQNTWDYSPPPQKPKSTYKSPRPKNTSP
jgi:hypothetical protein